VPDREKPFCVQLVVWGYSHKPEFGGQPYNWEKSGGPISRRSREALLLFRS